MNQTDQIVSAHDIKSRIQSVFRFLKMFFRNPVKGIQRLPEWDVTNIIILQLMITIPSGFLAGLVMESFASIVIQSIALPIISAILCTLATLVLFYIFNFLFDRRVDPLRLYFVIVAALLPMMVLRIFQSILPPIDLIGNAITCSLLVVGLVDNLALPRRGVIKLVGLLFFLFFLNWAYQLVSHSRKSMSYQNSIPGESIKTLDSELNK